MSQMTKWSNKLGSISRKSTQSVGLNQQLIFTNTDQKRRWRGMAKNSKSTLQNATQRLNMIKRKIIGFVRALTMSTSGILTMISASVQISRANRAGLVTRHRSPKSLKTLTWWRKQICSLKRSSGSLCTIMLGKTYCQQRSLYQS